jgi:hypothetical protein
MLVRDRSRGFKWWTAAGLIKQIGGLGLTDATVVFQQRVRRIR